MMTQDDYEYSLEKTAEKLRYEIKTWGDGSEDLDLVNEWVDQLEWLVGTDSFEVTQEYEPYVEEICDVMLSEGWWTKEYIHYLLTNERVDCA